MSVSICLKIIARLLAENAMLRQQLAVLKRKTKRPRISNLDRLFWVGIRLLGKKCKDFDWRSVLHMVKPDTVVSWHRKLAAKLHAWRSANGKRKGRPRVSEQVRALVQKIYLENPGWGAPKILNELAKLGVFLSQRTLQSILHPIKRPTPPKITQNWRTFIQNHSPYIWAADFFPVTTFSFKQIYVFVILHLQTR
jgi:hypothetical protein